MFILLCTNIVQFVGRSEPGTTVRNRRWELFARVVFCCSKNLLLLKTSDSAMLTFDVIGLSFCSDETTSLLSEPQASGAFEGNSFVRTDTEMCALPHFSVSSLYMQSLYKELSSLWLSELSVCQSQEKAKKNFPLVCASRSRCTCWSAQFFLDCCLSQERHFGKRFRSVSRRLQRVYLLY